MSLLENLVNNLLGSDEQPQEKPCANCPAGCDVFPDACGECSAYKEKLTDLLYDVEHIDAYYEKYEVVGTVSAPSGNTVCPYCGGPNPAGSPVCEYCGRQLREDSGKIQVASASEIPDPIQRAQDVIFERHTVTEKYRQNNASGFLEALAELVGGGDSFGDRMTTEEIKAVAKEYGVSVSTYLAGLDNGNYLTASEKKKQDRLQTAEFAIPTMTAGAFAAPQMGFGAKPPMQNTFGGRPPFPPAGPMHGPQHMSPAQNPFQQRPGQNPFQQHAPGQNPFQQQRPSQQRPAQQRPAQHRPSQQQTSEQPAQQQPPQQQTSQQQTPHRRPAARPNGPQRPSGSGKNGSPRGGKPGSGSGHGNRGRGGSR